MNPFYIHVGHGKTATTWLQNKIFPTNPQLNYFGKDENNYPEWLIRLHYLDDYAFEKEKEQIKSFILSKHLKDPSKVSLLSSEAFTNFTVIISQAKRIKEVFPSPRIILVLRNPISLIESSYKHNVKRGHFFLKIEEYLDWKRTPFALQKRRPIYLPDLFYEEVIDYYYELFGSHNVCVLKYEDFVNEPNDFMARLGSFIGVNFGDVSEVAEEKLREGMPKNLIKTKRIENLRKYISKSFPNIAKNIVADLESNDSEEIISPELAERLKKYFKGKCSMYFRA